MTETPRSIAATAEGGVRDSWRWAVAYVALLIIGNLAGRAFRYPELGNALFFLPYAIMTTALVVAPGRRILVVALGFVVHFAVHWPEFSLSWVILADVANIARALVAAELLRRVFGGAPRFESVEDLIRFVGIAVIAAPAVGATIGAANVMIHGASPTFIAPWMSWFLSSAFTGITILPALLLFVDHAPACFSKRPQWSRAGEAIAVAVAVVTTSTMAFTVPGETASELSLHFYAPLPAVIWAALRFGSCGASLGIATVSIAGVISADRGAGPFAGLSPDHSILMLQAVMVLTSLPVLCIAALTSARRSMVELHRALLASLRYQVAILDSRGVVIDVNDAWAQQWDTGPIQPLRQARVGDDYVKVCRDAVARGAAGAKQTLAGLTEVLGRELSHFELEYDEDSSDGPRRTSLRIERLERLDGGAVITRADVTARHLADIDAHQQRIALSHLARVAALGQFSGALAHELNQPLTSISVNAEAGRHILRRSPIDQGELDAILMDILAEDHRASEVIRRLRALLKRGEARFLAIDVEELISEVLGFARAELITQGITVSTNIATGPQAIFGDRVQLQQVLLNLILNACDAMKSTPPGERRLTIEADTVDAEVRIAIRDSGSGIAAGVLERLFEPFVSDKREGLGLGLSISRTIMVAHGGRLWAENNPTRGATVYCQLPAVGSRPPSAVVVAPEVAAV